MCNDINEVEIVVIVKVMFFVVDREWFFSFIIIIEFDFEKCS